MDSIKAFYNKNKDKKVIRFIDNFIHRVIDHQVLPKGGQLAYFIVLSIFPFIIALLNILNFTPLADTKIISDSIQYLPKATQNIVLSFLGEISVSSSAKLLSLSLLGGLWSASSGIRQTIKAINSAFRSKETRSFITLSILALTFTVALIILIILLLLTQVFGSKILYLLATTFHISPEIIELLRKLNIFIPLVYTVFTFASLYRFSPNVPKKELKWKFTLPGALFATFGIIISSRIFTFYVNNFGKYSVTYGSLTGVILLFLWLYLMSIIILIGGEINGIIYQMSGGDGADVETESFFDGIFSK